MYIRGKQESRAMYAKYAKLTLGSKEHSKGSPGMLAVYTIFPSLPTLMSLLVICQSRVSENSIYYLLPILLILISNFFWEPQNFFHH